MTKPAFFTDSNENTKRKWT